MSGLELPLGLASVQRPGNLGARPCFGDAMLRVSAMTWLIKGIDLILLSQYTFEPCGWSGINCTLCIYCMTF